MLPVQTIVVTTDNFWIGGRETFLAAYLGELKRRERAELRLFATDARGASGAALFDQVEEMGPRGPGELARWVEHGRAVLQERPADLIWAQHYRMLPAWWLSRAAGVPLLATFHGPLDGAGRPGSLVDALGAALVIHRAGLLTAVSEEVMASLVLVGASPERIRLLTNRVRVPLMAPARSLAPPVRVLLMCRADKLGHLREAIRFFHHLRKRLAGAELVVHRGTGAEAPSADEKRFTRRVRAAGDHLGRRWLSRHPELLSDLRRIRFEPLTADPEAAIRDADVVLGMGRVVLEGLAARRPTVLIGYELLVGLVDDRNFAAARRTNFSGRGAPAGNPRQVAAEVADALERGTVESRFLDEIDLVKNWPQARATLAEAVTADADPNGGELTSKIGRALAGGSGAESDLVALVLDGLGEPERRTFERLVSPPGR